MTNHILGWWQAVRIGIAAALVLFCAVDLVLHLVSYVGKKEYSSGYAQGVIDGSDAMLDSCRHSNPKCFPVYQPYYPRQPEPPPYRHLRSNL